MIPLLGEMSATRTKGCLFSEKIHPRPWILWKENLFIQPVGAGDSPVRRNVRNADKRVPVFGENPCPPVGFDVTSRTGEDACPYAWSWFVRRGDSQKPVDVSRNKSDYPTSILSQNNP